MESKEVTEKAIGEVLDSLSSSFEKEDEEKATRTGIKDAIANLISEHPTMEYTDPEIFYDFIVGPINHQIGRTIKEIFPSSNSSSKILNVFRYYSCIDRFLSNLMENSFGSFACSDRSRHLLHIYLKSLESKSSPEEFPEKREYWHPPIGSAQDWIDLTDGYNELLFGNYMKFMQQMSKLLPQILEHQKELKAKYQQ